MNIMLVWPGIKLPGFASLKMGGSNEATYINHGLSMLSAVLKREGHTCFSNDLRSFQSWKHFEDVVKTQNFDLTLIGFHSVDKDNALQVCRIIKNHFLDKPIIAGGPHVTIAQERELPNIDCIVWGEGETTILELVNDLKNLPKLVTGKPVDDLDSLPFVDRELVNCEFEKNSPLLPLLPVPFYTVNVGRGCPYSCRFCHQSGDNPIFTKRCRVRSVDNFLEELRTIMAGTGKEIGSLMIHDDVFPPKKWCEEFIGKMEWRIPFWCQMRADFICHNEDLITGLADIGLTWVSLGVESGSQRMLDFLNKKTTVEQNRKAIEILHRNNINIFANFFFGGPTETKEDIELSGDLIKESKFSWHSFSTYTCYPGSDLFKYCVDNDLFLDENYSMTRYPYERKIKGIDYDYLFNKLSEFSQYKGDLRKHIPKVEVVVKGPMRKLEFADIQENKDPIVSVILTSHNRPDLLVEAINSVFAQTMPDWELIIIDDCSIEPKVIEVLRRAKKESRVSVFRTNYDVDNIAVLWNHGLDLAKGKYISFLDDDNQKRPSFCKEMSKYLDEHPEFEAVACFNAIMKGDKLTGDIFDGPRHANRDNIIKRNYIDSGCMMIRRTTIDKIGWFDERLKTNEDWDYVKRVILQTTGFGIIEKPLANYRWHEENRLYRGEKLGHKAHTEFITSVKNYSNKLRLLLFHQDERGLTLSQNNVLRGIRDALKFVDWLEFESVPVSRSREISSRYDMIFCFAPFSINLERVKSLKNFSDEVINFHIEDPQALGNNLEKARHATYVFTNDVSVQREYEKITGEGNVGFCPSISLNDVSLKFRSNVDKKNDVVFFGHPYDSRIKLAYQLIPKIKRMGHNFILVGGDWSKRNMGVPCIDELSEQSALKILEESKIVVICNRKNTDLGGSPESMKAASVVRGYLECASGSLVMLDAERSHHCFNGDIVSYKGADDLAEKIDYYMQHKEEREVIAGRAKERALHNFTYRIRMNKLLNAVKSKRFYFSVD